MGGAQSRRSAWDHFAILEVAREKEHDVRTEFGVGWRGGPAIGVPKGHPARLHHVVVRQGDRGLEMLRLPSGRRDQVLPVFTAGWAARRYLFAEGTGWGWHVRACSPGELVSLLFGFCADVGWVALDPRPGHRCGALAANAMPRANFVDYLLRSRGLSSLRGGDPCEDHAGTPGEQRRRP
jgi:hypothetical protein